MLSATLALLSSTGKLASHFRRYHETMTLPVNFCDLLLLCQYLQVLNAGICYASSAFVYICKMWYGFRILGLAGKASTLWKC
jgi:hypothetical protein